MPSPTSIRSLFLEAKPTYPIAEAASLLGMDWREVRSWMESGELEGVEAFAWPELPG